MKIEFGFSKKKMLLLGTIGIIVVLTVSSFLLLNNGQVTQAAVIQPHPGLVGWWRLNDGSGTVASDSSGNGNNGTLVGSPLPSWVAGLYGGDALSFNGVNDYVSIPLSSSLESVFSTQQVSFSCWVNLASYPSSYADIIHSSDLSLILRIWSGGQFGMYNYLSNSWVGGSSGTIVPLDKWVFLCVVYDGSYQYCYMNGVLQSKVSATGTLMSPGQGYNDIAQGDGLYLNTVIDEVQAYNRALSATEILSDFNQAPDFSSYLVANVPQGTTQVITTLSWQGTGNITVTITTPSQTYTESQMQEYQKTTYSTTGGSPMSMLNIKRLSISVNALTTAQSWNITLTYSSTVSTYQISVETQN
jgi:hypothetical protein